MRIISRVREHMRLKAHLFEIFYKKVKRFYQIITSIESEALESYKNQSKYFIKEIMYDLFTVFFRFKLIEFLQDKYKKFIEFDAFIEKECRSKLPNFNLGKILKFDKSNLSMKTTKLYDLYVLIQGRLDNEKYSNLVEIVQNKEKILEKFTRNKPRASDVKHMRRIRKALTSGDVNLIIFNRLADEKKFRAMELSTECYLSIIFGTIDYFEAEQNKYKKYKLKEEKKKKTIKQNRQSSFNIKINNQLLKS